MISLTKLLSSCVDASFHGCQKIREFYRAGSVQGTLKDSSEIKSVVTQADIDAQACIVSSLRSTWGDQLRIIGEEDEAQNETDGTSSSALSASNVRNLNLHLCDHLQDTKVPLSELTIFVDPLDGTREFVEGRLQNVACLIGISQNSQSIAGVIGLPYPTGQTGLKTNDQDHVYNNENNDNQVQVLYAIANQPGSVGSWPKCDEVVLQKNDQKSDPIRHTTILTGDSKNAVLQNATKNALLLANNASHVIIGGTAAKLKRIAAAANNNDVLSVLHFKTELWDTCAPQALIQARGGKITDLFGFPLVHHRARPFGNIFGVVASSKGASQLHDQLCAKMRSDTKSVHIIFKEYIGDYLAISPDQAHSQAMDVARDLDGIPLDKAAIQKQIIDFHGIIESDAPMLQGYSVPEAGAWRGLMSTGCRLQLKWDDGNNPNNLPSSIFYKRVVMNDLSHAQDKVKTAPHKIVRDVKSYQVESLFLTSQACHFCRQETGLNINQVYWSDLRPVVGSKRAEDLIQSKFAIFLQDFNSNNWYQQWLIEPESTNSTLQTLATMHAYFWVGSNFWYYHPDAATELEDIVWSNGGYMQPALQGYDQFDQVAIGYRKRLPSFHDELKQIPELRDIDIESIGERLEKVAHTVGEKAHPFHGNTSDDTFAQYKTLIHGDPKQANIFFQDDNDTQQIGLIDFQWSGFGLAATDIAHHISAALDPSCLSFDGSKEKQLLDTYYSHLCNFLVKYGVAESIEQVQTNIYQRSLLTQQYETALLDICRMVFAYAWRRWKPESEPTKESLNRNSYNKSQTSALWLITRCATILESFETKKSN